MDIVIILALATFGCAIAFGLWSKSSTEKRLEDPQAPKSSLASKSTNAARQPRVHDPALKPHPEDPDLSPRPEAKELSPRPESEELSPQPGSEGLSPNPDQRSASAKAEQDKRS